MRVRFERFGLSVLLETDSSFLSPDANESAPDSLGHGTHRSNSPPPKSAHNHSTLWPSLREWPVWATGNAPSCRLPMDSAPREGTNQDMQTKSGSRNSVKQKVRIGKQDDNRPSTDLQGSPAISGRPTLCLPLHCSQDIDPIVSEIATPTHR